MRKLILTIATLLLTHGSARAEYAKTLSQANGPVTIEVVGSSANDGNTAVTVFFLAKRFDFTSGSAAPGARFVLGDQKITSGSRIIVEMDLPTPGPGTLSEAIITVGQALGGGTFTRTVDLLDTDDGGVHRFVFDVE